MKNHLVTKRITNQLKTIAILIVFLGHYARFKANPISIASHIPYFGAALFAFLSGYGVYVSYREKGINRYFKYIYAKIKRVVLPFVIINILAIPIYGINKSFLIGRVLLGTDDSVMWYPIFIMCFYILFATIYCQKISETIKLIILVGSFVVFYCLMVVYGLPSQWYTAILPLFIGILIGSIEQNLINSTHRTILIIVFATIIFAVSVFITLKTEGVIKYLITGLSGSSFSIAIFLAFEMMAKLLEHKFFDILEFTGEYSYWCYLIHMKVFFILSLQYGTDDIIAFAIYVAFTIIMTIIFGFVWKKVNNRTIKKQRL